LIGCNSHLLEQNRPATKCAKTITCFVVTSSQNLDESVSEVIKTEMKPLFGGLDPLDFNNEFLNKHKYSLPHQLAGEFVLSRLL
jgi:hypothetical protein